MLRTFQTDEEIYKKFKEICDREGVKIGDKLNEFLKDYIKVHGTGNPIYPLTQWIDEKDFKITPAFFESVVSKWNPYFDKCNKIELDEIRQRAEYLVKVANQRLRML